MMIETAKKWRCIFALPGWMLPVLVLACIGGCAQTAAACTSFVQKTPDGTIFGANLDLLVPADGVVVVNRRGMAKENFRKSTGGKTLKWVSKHGSITFNVAGRGFPWGGMNEAGLVVSGMEEMQSEFPGPDHRYPFDLGSWIQYVLDTCATVADVVNVDNIIRPEADNDRPSHFLADADGQVAALEYIDGKLAVYRGPSMPIAAMANMPYDRALYAYRNDGPRWWWSNPGRSAERVTIAANRIANYDPTRNKNPLSHVFRTLSMVANPDTRWSVACNIDKRKIWFRTRRSGVGKYFSFRDFDFSCTAPSLLLDVHTSASGHVADAFKPYNHQKNLALFETTCARLGIRVSHGDAVRVMRDFEGFSCAE
jgi:hypothetical protein